MLRRALLVDPNAGRLDLLKAEIGELLDVTTCTDFQRARVCLLTTAPDFLISNIRLGAYNGIHLAHLAVHSHLETRCLLYDEPVDLHLAFEAKLIGAFYETTSRVGRALASYIGSPLPAVDRRDARQLDQTMKFNGGRRATDLIVGPMRGVGPSKFLH
jgi:hypothetical protein